MTTYTLTKIISGREVHCETVEADSAEQAVSDALGWLTDSERQYVTYEATPVQAE